MNENQTSNVQKGLGKDALSVSDGTTAAATTSASADVKASNADQTQNQHLFHSYYQVNKNCYNFRNSDLDMSGIAFFYSYLRTLKLIRPLVLSYFVITFPFRFRCRYLSVTHRFKTRTHGVLNLF
jgi:hypothetical protein